MARYDCVIHLRTPPSGQGYNQQNPLRTETASAAAEIDARILHVWEQHPRRHIIDPAGNFLDKVAAALAILRAEMPECCAGHLPQVLRDHSE